MSPIRTWSLIILVMTCQLFVTLLIDKSVHGWTTSRRSFGTQSGRMRNGPEALSTVIRRTNEERWSRPISSWIQYVGESLSSLSSVLLDEDEFTTDVFVA